MQLNTEGVVSLSNLMSCTVCESMKTEVSFLKNDYRILHCKHCDHLFTDLQLTTENVDAIYSDDYFGGGDGYDDYTLEKNMLTSRGEYYADKIKGYALRVKFWI